MASTTTRRLRWIAPVAAAAVVAGGIVLPQLANASSAVDKLPQRSAAQLLAAVGTAKVDGLSGTVVTTSRLGLPALPKSDTGSGGSAVSLPGLLTGSTTARVWAAGKDKQRIAVDAAFAEYDVVRDGTRAYTYDSASSDVTRLTLPKPDAKDAPTPGAVTPESAAKTLLSYVEPSTTVSVGNAAMVAGRAAYELVLTPKDPGTLVGSVRLAVDGATSMPLRVQVLAKGQADPAIEIGYTSVNFAVPDNSVFAFTPPAGSKIKDKDLSKLAAHEARPKGTTEPGDMPTVLGKDWTSVVVARGVKIPAANRAMLNQLSKPVAGGRVITSALLSVLLTNDGRALVGAVPADRLVQLAAK